MKIKTAETTSLQLDWLVAEAQGLTREKSRNGLDKIHIATWVWVAKHPNAWRYSDYTRYSPSTNWEQGGQIIEENSISIIRCEDDWTLDANGYWTPKSKRIPKWAAVCGEQHSAGESYNSYGEPGGNFYEISEDACSYGPTPLIAAMRCYVASKLGDEVEIPEELK